MVGIQKIMEPNFVKSSSRASSSFIEIFDIVKIGHIDLFLQYLKINSGLLNIPDSVIFRKKAMFSYVTFCGLTPVASNAFELG